MRYEADWGRPFTLPFVLPKYATPEDYLTGASFSAGDVKLSKDGGAEANTTNLPTTVGNGYTLALTAAEGEAELSIVRLIDSATKLWMDTALIVDRSRRDTALQTKTVTINSQTSFTLSAGSGTNDAYTALDVTIYDASNNYAACTREIVSYTGSTKTVVLDLAMDFLIATGDLVRIHGKSAARADVRKWGGQYTPVNVQTTGLIGVHPIEGGDIIHRATAQGGSTTSVVKISVSAAADFWKDYLIVVGGETRWIKASSGVNITIDTDQGGVLAGDPTGFDVVILGTRRTLDYATVRKIARNTGSQVDGIAQTGTLTTSEMTTNLTVAYPDQYKDRAIRWLTGILAGVETLCIGSVVSGGKLIYQTVPTPPANGDEFIIL